LREFEDIFNRSQHDADELAAFFKMKATARSQNNPQLFRGSDISFDVDVDLIKLPAKPTETVQQEAVHSSIPRNNHNLVIESQPQTEVPRLQEPENIPIRRSLSEQNMLLSSTTPKESFSQIRCVDIRLLSQRKNKNSTFNASTLDFVSNWLYQ